MKVRLYFTIQLLLSFIHFLCFSQKVDNVDFEIRDSIMIIKYDLTQCQAKKLYNMKVIIQRDSGDIEPYSLYGDINYVDEGRGKKIEWDVFKDRKYLTGKMKVLVKVAQVHSTKAEGGPSCAFLSMLLPGLGDKYVNPDNKTVPYLIGTAFVSSTFFMIRSKILSDKAYKAYHDAREQDEMDKYYNLANNYHSTYQVFLSTSVAIWIGDVVFVTIKGFSNKKKHAEQLRTKSKKVYLTFIPAFNQFQFGLVKKF